MNSPLGARELVRQLDQSEQAMLDALVVRFNQEIPRVIKFVEPGNSFTVSVQEDVELADHRVERPTRIVMNAVADSFRREGWAVDAAVQGCGCGSVELILVRPPREVPLIPNVTPFSVLEVPPLPL